MKNEIQHIIELLSRTFEEGAWHGPTVKEVLAPISEKQAQFRLPETHSIVELVNHMTTWRKFTAIRLQGDDDFKVNEDEDNFPARTNWPQALNDLNESQAELVKAITNFPEEKLDEILPGSDGRYTYYHLIHGIIHHDLYHIGQIRLMMKAQSGNKN